MPSRAWETTHNKETLQNHRLDDFVDEDKPQPRGEDGVHGGHRLGGGGGAARRRVGGFLGQRLP